MCLSRKHIRHSFPLGMPVKKIREITNMFFGIIWILFPKVFVQCTCLSLVDSYTNPVLSYLITMSIENRREDVSPMPFYPILQMKKIIRIYLKILLRTILTLRQFYSYLAKSLTSLVIKTHLQRTSLQSFWQLSSNKVKY